MNISNRPIDTQRQEQIKAQHHQMTPLLEKKNMRTWYRRREWKTKKNTCKIVDFFLSMCKFLCSKATMNSWTNNVENLCYKHDQCKMIMMTAKWWQSSKRQAFFLPCIYILFPHFCEHTHVFFFFLWLAFFILFYRWSLNDGLSFYCYFS